MSQFRRAASLSVEGLDEKVLASGNPVEVQAPIVFGVYSDGTYAHNLANDVWLKITSAKPTAMDEGANGTMFASYSDGLYKYVWGSGWTKMNTPTATVLDAGNDNTLVAVFQGQGTWEYDGSWDQIYTAHATDVAVVSNNHCYLEFGDGLWEWHNNNWLQRSTGQVAVMDAAADGTLFASLTAGVTYRFADGGGATWLANTIASSIAAVNFSNAYISYYTGTFSWNNVQGFDLITTTSTTQLHYEAGYGNVGGVGGLVGVYNTGTFIYAPSSDDLYKLTNAKASLL